MGYPKFSNEVIREMVSEVHEVNDDNGWFDETRTFGDEVALIHSEVSEALEAYREWGFESRAGKDGKPEGVGSELADILIRVLDTCYRHDIDLYEEYRLKLAYNKRRGYKHGGKKM